MNRLGIFLLVLISAAGCLAGETTKRRFDATDLRFAPPLMGYVFDRGLGQIRIVVGIPGAARVAGAVKLDIKLKHVLLGPGGNVALASAPDGTALTVVGSLDSQPTVVGVENSTSDFDAGAFNRSGTAAIVYSSGCQCFQILEGLADAPHVRRNIDASSIPGSIIALALSDDNALAAAAVAGSEDGTSQARIVLLDLSGDNAPPPIITSTSALAFTPSGKDLMVADIASGALLMALQAGGIIDVASSLTAADSGAISNPDAIAFAGAGLLLIADRAGLVHIVNLQTNERKSVTCFCRPDSMEAMKDKSVYRLTGTDAGALWILDMSAEPPRTLFVPIDASDNTDPANRVAP